MEELKNLTDATINSEAGVTVIDLPPTTKSGVKVKFDCKSALIGGAAGAVVGIIGKIIFDKIRSEKIRKAVQEDIEEYFDEDENDTENYTEV